MSKKVSPKTAAKSRTRKTEGASSQKDSSREESLHDSFSGTYVSVKTGRVVKASPAKPRLGSERIKSAVRSVVHGDAETGKASD